MTGSIERRITLELNRTGVQTRIPVRQGDSLVHRLRITASLNGRAYAPANVTWAQVKALLPDGTAITADCTNDGKEYTLIPGAGFFRCAGPVLCRLILRSEDGAELYTPAFAFDVEKTFAASVNATDAEEYSRMAELLQEMLEIREQCQEIAASAGDMTLTVTKASPGTRDKVTFYSDTDESFYGIVWDRVVTLMSKAITWIATSGTAESVTDEAGTGFTAVIPELADDDTLVVGSEFEKLSARVAALEAAAAEAE